MAACPNQTFPEEFDTSDCHIMHPLQKFYSLKSFRSQTDQLVKNGQDKYYVQPCGKSSKCSSPICLEHHGKILNMGKLASAQFLMDEQEMRIKYEDGDPCVPFDAINMTYSSEIRFVCDDSSSASQGLELLDDLPCHPIFLWTSSQVCGALTQNDPNAGHYLNSKNSSSVWTIVILGIGVIFVVFFLRKPQNRERVHDKIVWLRVLCLRRRRRNEDRNLLVENNVTIPTFGTLEVDDDDDLIIA